MKKAFFTSWIGYLLVLYLYFKFKQTATINECAEYGTLFLAGFLFTIVLIPIVAFHQIHVYRRKIDKIDHNYLVGCYVTLVVRTCFDIGGIAYGSIFYLKPIVLMLFCAIITTFIVWEHVIKRRLTKLERLFD